MFTATLLFSIAWIFWCVAQWIFAFFFQKAFAQDNTNEAVPAPGRASILLAVRGSDPSFRDCLDSLLSQDHPDFEIHVIVDSPSDPAMIAIEECQQDPRAADQLFVHVSPEPLKTCGLKCSALLHGLKQIDENIDYLVLVDSDVVVHVDWLNHLLAPLVEPKIGVVTGNQWFEPPRSANSATWIRSIWNAGAMVPAVLYGNTWAGSLAMRKSDFERAGLPERWQNSIVDDGPIPEAMKRIGLKTQFVPELLMINEESCDGKFVIQYVRRMLTWSKLFDPTFVLTIGHAGLMAALMISLTLLTLLGLLTAHWAAAMVGLSGLFVGAAATTIGYTLVRKPIAATNENLHGTRMQKLSLVRLAKVFFLCNTTQLLYAKSLISAIANQTVRWRGATYEVISKSKCRVVDCRPFESRESNSSII